MVRKLLVLSLVSLVAILVFFDKSALAQGDRTSQVFKQGWAAYQEREYPEAIRYFRQYLGEFPDDGDVARMVINLLFMEERYQEAEASARELLSKEPGNAQYKALLDWSLMAPRIDRMADCQDSGNLSCLFRESQAVIAEVPTAPVGYMSLGIALLLKGDPQDLRRAGTLLEEARRLNDALPADHRFQLDRPTLAILYQGLGVSTLGLRDYRAAEGYFARSLELDPGLEDGQANLEAARSAAQSRPSETVVWLSIKDILNLFSQQQ